MHEDPGITETDMSWALEGGEVDGDDEDVLGLPLDYIPWKERWGCCTSVLNSFLTLIGSSFLGTVHWWQAESQNV